MADFNYQRPRTVTGIAWYCQVPGLLWRTDPALGWSLFYTDGPTWWLMGNGVEIELPDTWREATEAAAIEIKRISQPKE